MKGRYYIYVYIFERVLRYHARMSQSFGDGVGSAAPRLALSRISVTLLGWRSPPRIREEQTKTFLLGNIITYTYLLSSPGWYGFGNIYRPRYDHETKLQQLFYIFSPFPLYKLMVKKNRTGGEARSKRKGEKGKEPRVKRDKGKSWRDERVKSLPGSEYHKNWPSRIFLWEIFIPILISYDGNYLCLSFFLSSFGFSLFFVFYI